MYIIWNATLEYQFLKVTNFRNSIDQSKLEEAQITNDVENNYLTFTTTPTATSLKVMVDLQDEKKAFEIIDAYLQQNEN